MCVGGMMSCVWAHVWEGSWGWGVVYDAIPGSWPVPLTLRAGARGSGARLI